VGVRRWLQPVTTSLTRLPRRRHERSGAAAVMRLVLEWTLTACWRAFPTSRKQSPYPALLGGLYGSKAPPALAGALFLPPTLSRRLSRELRRTE
jgi:hypothetical protein